MKKVISALVAFAAMTSATFASDLAARAPAFKAPIVAAYNWTGRYAGVNGGGAATFAFGDSVYNIVRAGVNLKF